MKEIKTFEQILRETVSDDFTTEYEGPESPEFRAAKAYAEQFIDKADEEADKFAIEFAAFCLRHKRMVQLPDGEWEPMSGRQLIDEYSERPILKLKEHLK